MLVEAPLCNCTVQPELAVIAIAMTRNLLLATAPITSLLTPLATKALFSTEVKASL